MLAVADTFTYGNYRMISFDCVISSYSVIIYVKKCLVPLDHFVSLLLCSFLPVAYTGIGETAPREIIFEVYVARKQPLRPLERLIFFWNGQDVRSSQNIYAGDHRVNYCC